MGWHDYTVSTTMKCLMKSVKKFQRWKIIPAKDE